MLGIADTPVDLEALGLDALFGDVAPPAPRLPLLTGASRVVCWLGARDAAFVRRLGTLVPGAVVAPSVGGNGLVWEHLLGTVGAPAGDWRRALAPSDALRAEGERALHAAGWDGARALVIVHPGAGGEDKRWAPAAFATVLGALAGRATIVVHCGPADATAAAELRALLPGTGLLEEPTLTVLAGALAHASLYLGNDSGPSHLAAALGTPAIVLYAERNLAWRPWEPAARVLVVQTQAARAADVERVGAALRTALG
ncbi:MAG: glycosyltransferase family 9 protein [Candidatus Rokuibacteriota bacterium]